MLLGWHVDSNLSRRMLPPPRVDRDPRRPARRLPLQPQPHANRLPRRGEDRERPRPVLLLRRGRRSSQRNVRRGASPTPRSRRCRSNGRSAPRSSTRCLPRSRSRAVLARRPTPSRQASGRRTTPVTSCRSSPTRSSSRRSRRSATSGSTRSSDRCSRGSSKNWGSAAA